MKNIAIYNTSVEGVIYVSDTIQTSLTDLRHLIDRLSLHGFNYLAHNTDGIIYEKTEMEDIKILSNEIENIKELLDENPTYLREEVTKEFFLFYDMLPEEIRKQIKIYVKQ